MKTTIVIGGGAAGFFSAICCKKKDPKTNVLLLEKTNSLLSKVKISGGGRCNVTHACFNPKELVKYYPRGSKELLGPFHTFGPKETIHWFRTRGVQFKTERDGRVFPVSDDSQTVINCLLAEADRLGVVILKQIKIATIDRNQKGFILHLKNGKAFQGEVLILATGSHTQGYQFAEHLGHTIIQPIPSLFTFNVPSSPLKQLSGVAVSNVELHIMNSKHCERGPLLITHFGFSGPAAIKLSAWEAEQLFEKNYHTDLIINWIPDLTQYQKEHELLLCKRKRPEKQLSNLPVFDLPKTLWKKLVPFSTKLKEIKDQDLKIFAQKLHADRYHMEGKTTNKEEFVTCGGVKRSEVNFKTMESKKCPRLFFAGEILDIDGITGGFNF
ncbi:MAG: NAD(P)/FAD-dependent oxidoreductase [Chlamydiia bacterium]|nr:NAD(P)/FAD-dependent oxidoreductase [Chlamydiia bacterium]